MPLMDYEAFDSRQGKAFDDKEGGGGVGKWIVFCLWVNVCYFHQQIIYCKLQKDSRIDEV